MKIMQIGELKSNFSQVLQEVEQGEEIVVSFGKKKKKVAVILPYKKYKGSKVKLGLLEGKASFSLGEDFKISDEELFAA